MGDDFNTTSPMQVGSTFYRKINGTWYEFHKQMLTEVAPEYQQEVVDEFRVKGLGSGDNDTMTWVWVAVGEAMASDLDGLVQVAKHLDLDVFGNPLGDDGGNLSPDVSVLAYVYRQATTNKSIPLPEGVSTEVDAAEAVRLFKKSCSGR